MKSLCHFNAYLLFYKYAIPFTIHIDFLSIISYRFLKCYLLRLKNQITKINPYNVLCF